MARKTKEEALATRAQLLDAAQRVFCERGVAHTSLHEVACAAGLTRGAVYWHFENKTDLLVALWERLSLPIDQAMEEMDRRFAHDPLERLRAKTLAILERIATDDTARAVMSILLLKCEWAPETEAALHHLLEMREGCLDKNEADFRAAIAAGQLSADLEPRALALGMFSVFDGCCFHWLVAPERYDLKTFGPLALNAYLAGLPRPATESNP